MPLNEKKLNIMNAAVKLFAEKGYHATSIQDIADALGIAKGAMYFYFKSKEELLLNICEHYLSIFLQEFTAVMSDASREPKARLAKQIILKSERFSDNRDFIAMFVKERFEVTDEMHALFQRFQDGVLKSTQQCIIEAYGNEVVPYARDLSIMFTAMTDGYLGKMYFEKSKFDLSALANFLVGRLNDLVQGILAAKPDPIIGIEP